HREAYRVIRALGEDLQHAHRNPRIADRVTADRLEETRADVVRAREAGEDSSGLQETRCAEVDLLVAARSRIHGVLATREGWRIEHDQAETFAARLECPKRVERVRLVQLRAFGDTVQLQVAPGERQSVG